MYSQDIIRDSIAALSDVQLVKRIRGGEFSDEVLPIAQAELARRGISGSAAAHPLPTTPRDSVSSSLPVLLVLLAQAFFAFLAIWQVLTLLPAFGLLGRASEVPLGTWLSAGIKFAVLVGAASFAFMLGRWRPRVRAWTQRSRRTP